MELLWLKCLSESVFCETIEFWEIVNKMEYLLRLPQDKLDQQEVLDVFQRMKKYKENMPDPKFKYERESSKTQIIFKLTLEKLRSQETTWEQKLEDLMQEYNRIKGNIEMETFHYQTYVDGLKSFENGAAQIMKVFPHLS